MNKGLTKGVELQFFDESINEHLFVRLMYANRDIAKAIKINLQRLTFLLFNIKEIQFVEA